MQVRLAEWLRDSADGTEAAAVLGRCVQCGFCNATCPTYRLLGDELDGPRGRIYLMKQVVEGQAPTARTQLHLDRCLTCRACETTCPSGVEYGRLLDVGRRLVAAQVPRPAGSRVQRAVLRAVLSRTWLFTPLLRIAQLLRPLLPGALAARLPARQVPRPWPAARHARRVLLPGGCVQPGLMPNVDAATARVLDALGYAVLRPTAGCCGALRQHLDDPAGALATARRNIDTWWPAIEAGVETIVSNASGCGVMLRDYGRLLRDDPAYAARAQRVVALVRDVGELVAARLDVLAPRVRLVPGARIVFHPPCTLQHGQGLRGQVEAVLAACGATLLPFADAQQCCGSAGTYSLLQPALATRLRDAKLAALQSPRPDVILSANVGCIAHLATAAGVPVRHWIEWLDERLAACDG